MLSSNLKGAATVGSFFKSSLYFILLLGVCSVFGAKQEKAKSSPLTREAVMQYLNICDGLIANGKTSTKRPITGLQYRSFAAQVGVWLKNPDLEADTGITKAWYIKIQKAFLYMSAVKRKLEMTKMDKMENSSEAQKHKDNFSKAYDYFVKLVKNPELVPKERLRELKRLKQRRMNLI
jgi:hypothetical protein